jgi:hypothetical protein
MTYPFCVTCCVAYPRCMGAAFLPASDLGPALVVLSLCNACATPVVRITPTMSGGRS